MSTTEKPSQLSQIAHLLRQGWTCATELHAVCWRYSARIHELKSAGVLIEDRPCTCKNGHPGMKHYRIADGNQRGLAF